MNFRYLCRAMKRIISPSMLSADFGHLRRDTRMIDRSAAEWVHIDVMDGVFVPNLSFGFPVIKAIRAATDKFLDVHLMIVEPEKYIARFAAAGADLITIHAEATDDLGAALDMIHAVGARAGVSIKPATSPDVLEPYLDRMDLVLVMSVEPGFGGQSFIPGSLDKVRELRRMIDARGLPTLIEIDGGISADNAREVFDAGVEVIVAGAAVFGKDDPPAEIEKMLRA
jgi:ribulose-phosphate 3-epimerase